jgi:hypothetical protein
MPIKKPITVNSCVLKNRSTCPPSQPQPSITKPIARILESQFKASLAGDTLGIEGNSVRRRRLTDFFSALRDSTTLKQLTEVKRVADYELVMLDASKSDNLTHLKRSWVGYCGVAFVVGLVGLG